MQVHFTPVGVSGGRDSNGNYELTWRLKEGVELNTRGRISSRLSVGGKRKNVKYNMQE